ncbi:MAG: cobalamin-binding protein [Actinomycetia bacterium]|nr:cobalamin-binding protein [Actinomycetes bacterium]MCP5035149.1 cobalamin-binding protein [Actinomycetes bacterium]
MAEGADQPGEEILDRLYDSILRGQADEAVASTRSALEVEIEPMSMLFDSMIPALEEVGRLFESNQIFIPEMLVAARAMDACMEHLRPLLADGAVTSVGTFVMGTIAGDIHDIGKNLCTVMLEGAGFEVVDLGVNVAASTFVAAIEEHRPDAVGLSAFLTTTMSELATTIDAITESGLRADTRILVGGAPVNQEYADSIGADGYAPNAVSAVRETKALLGL